MRSFKGEMYSCEESGVKVRDDLSDECNKGGLIRGEEGLGKMMGGGVSCVFGKSIGIGLRE